MQSMETDTENVDKFFEKVKKTDTVRLISGGSSPKKKCRKSGIASWYSNNKLEKLPCRRLEVKWKLVQRDIKGRKKGEKGRRNQSDDT